MRIPRIYVDATLAPSKQLVLAGQQGHYLLRVLRRGIGDEVRLFNGQGGEYVARVVAIRRDSAELAVDDHLAGERESTLPCHLGLALSKGDRFDWAIQKCTELGVGTITPLTTERCDVRLPPQRQEKRLAHWRQIAISACEQSGRNCLPTINPVHALPAWLAVHDGELALVCAGHGEALNPHITTSAPSSISLLVGPEGGLSNAEIELAGRAGFTAVSFGPRTLRTETAPVTVLSIVQYLWGDLA